MPPSTNTQPPKPACRNFSTALAARAPDWQARFLAQHLQTRRQRFGAGEPGRRGQFRILRRRHPRVGRIAVAVFDWKDVFTTDSAFAQDATPGGSGAFGSTGGGGGGSGGANAVTPLGGAGGTGIVIIRYQFQ